MNLPNKLTFTRIAIVPFFILSVELGGFWWSVCGLLFFIAASLTDFFDGRIARKNNMVTSLGIFLDPLADKLLVSSAFIMFVQVDALHIPAWMVIAIIAREFLITGFRTLAVSKNVIIPADKSGKFKTTSQIVVIITILVITIIREWYLKFQHATVDAGANTTVAYIFDKLPFWAVLVVVFLTLYSGANYLLKHRDLLKE
jgi:CDP-diacylglycerol--glycerol-3-phosphate 3-phosphatidyltransferase